jgi:thiol-disulfide isomerase/thioredoxin
LVLVATAALAAPEMIPADVFEAAKSAPAPSGPVDFTMPLRGGGTFTSAEHRGKPVLLTFWASWCGPCRLELPALSTWAQSHPDVTVLAVNVDRAQPLAERFLQSVQFSLPVAFDPDAKQLGQYGVTSMPTMFLFDRTGAMAWQHTGYSQERGFSELDAAIGALK